jgi:FkbM family methyltransferase
MKVAINGALRRLFGRGAEPLRTPAENECQRSFAIEAEDLLILRLLQACVKGAASPGFFVDIGAYRPVRGSNTYLLYQQGWRGVNVEPNPEYIPEFRAIRPEDVTVNTAISDTSRTLLYRRFDNPLLNGFLSDEQVAYTVSHGRARHLGDTPISCLGVKEFLHTYVKKDTDVLTLDVESHEEAILSAWDWQSYRPKLICIEIHAPTIDAARSHPVTALLEGKGYRFVSRGWQSACFVDGRFLTYPGYVNDAGGGMAKRVLR